MPLLTDHLKFGSIFFRNKTYSSETIIKNINLVSDYLDKNIISNSPFVYLFAPNHIKMVYAFFGIIKSGRICVLVDPGLGHIELEEMMSDTVPSALIRIEQESDEFVFSREINCTYNALSAKDLYGLEDVCLILYTNGCDGWMKGAMLTNRNILANAEAIIGCNGIDDRTISCAIIAFHHLFGLQTGLIAPSLVHGNLLIEDVTDFKALRSIGEHLKERSVTHIYSVPVVYYLIMKLPRFDEIFTSVRSLVSGGCKLSSSIFNLYTSKFGIEIHEGYGLTEASPICTWHRPDDEIVIESVGRAFPCCEIKIVDCNNQELPCGHEGEVCVKGTTIFKGYYNKKFATNTILKNGFLHTGDMGKLDSKGYLYLTGQKKNMLNINGNKVYPSELERLIRKNDNVKDVRVNGQEDQYTGTTIAASVWLKSKSTQAQQEFKSWYKTNIALLKMPRKLTFL